MHYCALCHFRIVALSCPDQDIHREYSRLVDQTEIAREAASVSPSLPSARTQLGKNAKYSNKCHNYQTIRYQTLADEFKEASPNVTMLTTSKFSADKIRRNTASHIWIFAIRAHMAWCRTIKYLAWLQSDEVINHFST